MNMPTPTEGHRMLERLTGFWEGEETMHPSQWDPQGGTAIGRNRYRTALGGFAVVADYEQERDGVITFTGHGIYSYDPERDVYTLYWLDSMGSPPELFHGGFDGDRFVMTSRGPHMHVRLTWDLRREGYIDSMMEMSEDGSSWMTLFDAVYVRKEA